MTRTLGLLGMAWVMASCGAVTEVLYPSTSTDPASGAVTTPPPTAVATPAVTTTAPADSQAAPQTDYFREAVNRATSAVAIGQSAQSPTDWQLAAGRWQQAIALMQQVPVRSSSHVQAQAKIQEYQRNLTAAQQRATGRPAAAAAPAQPSQSNGLVAQIPIQERRGGTPVVAVTLRGQTGGQTFPMLFDTGATGTLITAAMAQTIGVVVVGETQATIADGSVVTLPIGYVDVIEVGGLRKESILVAIGGEVGLLGQDFYGEYGIAMGSEVINLHQ
ncbi:MAG: TIGR02281 family clan AA aspartic protease [Nodosilinea sp.]